MATNVDRSPKDLRTLAQQTAREIERLRRDIRANLTLIEALQSAGGGGTPDAHATSHENGGSDEISVAGLTGLLATAQTPAAHASSHESGGADPVNLAGLPTDLYLMLSSDVGTALVYMPFNESVAGTNIAVNAANWVAPFDCEVVSATFYCLTTGYGDTIVGAHVNENTTPDTSDTQTLDEDTSATWTLGTALTAGDRLAISFDGQFAGGHFTGYVRIRPT